MIYDSFTDEELLVDPEQYSKITEKTALELLPKQEKYFTDRPLQDPEPNDTAEYLAFGDSMFHHMKLEQRLQYGEAAKASYGGQRFAELFEYCSFSFSRTREVIIFNVGTNDLLKRHRYPKGPLTVEECFETMVAIIEWCFNFYSPKFLMLCTLIQKPKDERFNRDAE